MSDARTRELERAAAAGDVEARVAWIAARLRAGALEEERVALAAHVGDPAARLALGLDPDASHESPAALAEGLARWCATPEVSRARLVRPGWRDQLRPRAALAIARLGCAGETLPAGAARTFEAVEAWLRAPSLAAAEGAQWTGAVSASPREALVGLLAWECYPDPRRRSVRIRDTRFVSGLSPEQAREACDRPGGVLAWMASYAASRKGETALLCALHLALADWALDAPWRADL